MNLKSQRFLDFVNETQRGTRTVVEVFCQGANVCYVIVKNRFFTFSLIQYYEHRVEDYHYRIIVLAKGKWRCVWALFRYLVADLI